MRDWRRNAVEKPVYRAVSCSRSAAGVIAVCGLMLFFMLSSYGMGLVIGGYRHFFCIDKVAMVGFLLVGKCT